ncbi:expressed unknown protein [Seminavis robusta]|uniref:Uncharacterized protein n=1 Tax=Seminavis robusta TaxID=568900 RepID=A0A9N8HPA5_9STRA|nr:expressed unknown protein [Seminavis robusta]|eukprot:Sro887_g216260.1 n/a (131) ;mRNA; r:5053-5521
MMMLRSTTTIAAVLWLCVSVDAFLGPQQRQQQHPSSVLQSVPETTEDPCWQDLYDEDCAMSSVYSASFVAGKWIKSMPCAKGLDEDCDMGDLDVPEMRPEAGVDNVDVMGFLGLKKAEPVQKSDEDEVAP